MSEQEYREIFLMYIMRQSQHEAKPDHSIRFIIEKQEGITWENFKDLIITPMHIGGTYPEQYRNFMTGYFLAPLGKYRVRLEPIYYTYGYSDGLLNVSASNPHNHVTLDLNLALNFDTQESSQWYYFTVMQSTLQKGTNGDGNGNGDGVPPISTEWIILGLLVALLILYLFTFQ